MSPFQRHRWFLAAAGITLAFAIVCVISHKGFALSAISDIATLAVMAVPGGILLANVFSRPSEERSFWILMTLGFSLWIANTSAWTYLEVVLKRVIPDPYFFDIILFFHVVPMIAAVAWRPDRAPTQGKSQLMLLNFMMLLGWWAFLYAFIVFPHQYVVLNVTRYDLYYDRLYLVENIALVLVLGVALLTSSGGWKRLYRHFFLASAVYGVSSQLLDRAVSNHTYYSGSLYDAPLVGAVAWMAAAAMSAKEWDLKTVEFKSDPRWTKLIPHLAMLAILSLPMLGLWTVLLDQSTAPARQFRIYTVLGGMLVLGTFVFLRQYLQDQALIGLLNRSRRGYESQKQLQGELVQKEKLASLGTLVAGAAHEINHPLTTVMSYCEQMWGLEGLTDEQNSILRKIVAQARRTSDLVVNLLSFAQRTPGEKVLVDLGIPLTRATQMLESRRAGGKIRVTLFIEPNFPRVLGNANQLFQAFIEIIENAMDALEDAGGGSLYINALRLGEEVVVHFSDDGLGIREPQRVFDPFYTTKAVGKGTGLGLSAVYGVIQEHSGQITCQNKPEGGALFIVKLPVAAEPAAQVAGAGSD